MRRRIAALTMGSLMSLALLPAAHAQEPSPPPPPNPMAEAAPAPVERLPPPPRAGGGALWFVAEKLAAAEIALGITPEQQAPWRGFAQAAIALAEAGGPGPRAGDETGGVERFKHMLEAQTRRGEAAAELSRALDTLGAALTPAQRATADRLLADLPPPFADPGGPRGAGAPPPPPPMGPPGDRDAASAPRFDKPSLFTR
ncbi:Spy/CpxP family protein refolding chaperone [Aureimonas sp. AU20]|uniref:Spy/CpxP family protein refolding chaperone n=1 Tax=Aureimonas sp. AU20 TaxID=1349819 RepID=UPI0009E67479|nr:Spy/CpxP family protein refolding chaperone [Aureimonas sp. AU20]